MDLKIKSSFFLNKKSIKKLKDRLVSQYGEEILAFFTKGIAVEQGKLNDGRLIILIQKKPAFFEYEIQGGGLLLVPFIPFARKMNFKCVIVDQPAVPYITDGADVMRPGIVEFDSSIKENDIVGIKDEKNRVIIAVGITLYNFDDMMRLTKGKVIKTLHYAGDKLFKLYR
ncbi:MAG: PUA domain-containing protein [Promethearchaeota archaeon]